MTMFSDNFNRANGAIGAGWVNVDAAEPFLVVDNAAHATVADTPALVAVDAAFDADQEASLTFTAVNVADRAGPAVRVDTANDTAYFIDADGFSGTDRRLVRWAAGVKTVIGTVNIAPVAGDRVTLRAVGSTLTVYVNGVLVDTVVDATHASGAPGMYYQRSNTGATRLDDFVGTDAFVKRVGTTQSGGGGQSASRTWVHTTVGTVNPALTIALFFGDVRGPSPVTAITVDGVSIADRLALSALHTTEPQGVVVYVVPGLAAGAHTIDVQYDADPTFGNPENWYASEEHENINQAQPVRVGATFVQGGAQGVTVGLTIPSDARDLVVGFAAMDATVAITPDSSLTTRYENTGSDYKSFVDKPGAAESTVQYSIPAGGNVGYVVGALSLQPPGVSRGAWQTSTTDTVGIVIPDEPNRVVEAAFTIEVRGTAFTTFPVTCGGVPMHEVVGSPSASPNGVAVVRRFYLLDSELPAAGAQNVVAAPTGGADVSYRSAAVVHTNVAQSAPVYIEASNDITDTLRIPDDPGTWAYADGDLATGILCGGDGTLVFAWPSPWDEHFDDADGTGDSRSTGGSRSYSGAGTDSVTVVAAGAQRTAGSVLVWSVASAGGGGGTAFEQATAGALAISGALARAVIRAAAGSVAPSAITTVTRAAVRAVSGSSAPAGTVMRRADRPAGGAAAPTGSLARTTARETSGAVAGSGALQTTRVTTQAVAGSVALEAAVARELRRALLASAAPTGGISRRPARAVSGSAAPTAQLARRMTRALAGSVAPNGETVPVRALTLAVGGAVAVSAFLGKLTGRAVGGAVSPLGLATRAMRKALDGSAAPAGRVGRSVSRVLSGATQILGGVVAAIVGAIERVRGMRVTDRSEPTVLVTDESESAVLVTDRSESAVIVTDLSTL